MLGTPRVHYRLTDSTNARARFLAGAGAPHGTVVTAGEQSAGRGRQGRTWSAPAGRALLCSIVIRDPVALLPLAAGVAVAEAVEGQVGGAQVVEGQVGGAQAVEGQVGGAQAVEGQVGGAQARVKWPNDVLVDGRKVAGILVEGRPQEGWAVVGIGLNVALRPEDFPAELRDRAGTLGLDVSAIEPTLEAVLVGLERWMSVDSQSLVAAVRERDALLGREVRWAGGQGIGAGIDGGGRLVVETESGTVALDAGEVHLISAT